MLSIPALLNDEANNHQRQDFSDVQGWRKACGREVLDKPHSALRLSDNEASQLADIIKRLHIQDHLRDCG